MLKIAKTHKHVRNMQKCAKNISKYAQNAKDPKKIPQILENAQKLQILCKIAAKSRQTLPRSSTTSRNGAGMHPRPLSDPPKSLQNPSKIEDSWHESFFSYVFVACAEKTHNTIHLKLRISSIEHQY